MPPSRRAPECFDMGGNVRMSRPLGQFDRFRGYEPRTIRPSTAASDIVRADLGGGHRTGGRRRSGRPGRCLHRIRPSGVRGSCRPVAVSGENLARCRESRRERANRTRSQRRRPRTRRSLAAGHLGQPVLISLGVSLLVAIVSHLQHATTVLQIHRRCLPSANSTDSEVRNRDRPVTLPTPEDSQKLRRTQDEPIRRRRVRRGRVAVASGCFKRTRRCPRSRAGPPIAGRA